MAALVALAGVLGLAVGSFLNVIIWRVPLGKSVVRPRSACPTCQEPLKAYDNIPLVSWLILQGRCRNCKASISARYPLIEAATSVAFMATVWWLGESWQVVPLLYLAAVSIALSAIDLEYHRLPDAIVLPSIAVFVLAFFVLAWVGNEWGTFGRAVLAGVTFLVVYLVMVILYPAGMGLGDVKLAPALGLVLGWWGWGAVLVGFFAAFVAGGVASLALILRGSHGRKSGIPFGPFMFIGTYVGLLWGNSWWDAYLNVITG